jgi:putative glutamine amidotransferase
VRPLIGIPCRARADRPDFYNDRLYVSAVEHAGGMPLLLPMLDDMSILRAFLPHLDGLLLSGGIDVDPAVYGEEAHPMLGVVYRPMDEFHLEIVRWAIARRVPTLAICRGMQLLNVAMGGNLYQDLPSQRPGSLAHAAAAELPRNTIIHEVRVQPGSLAERVLGQREVPANSLHHQAVKNIGAGIVVSGYAEDGVVELLEVPAQPFMLAAQCHPEELYKTYPVWARLFEAFILACAKR